MSDATTQLVAPRRLRVAIYAADPLRRTALRRLIANADHDVADSTEAADVLLCDGDCPSTEARPFVTLGGTDTGQAGSLASDADANQIDAALRAVAAGLAGGCPRGEGGGVCAEDEKEVLKVPTAREVE